MRIRQHLHPHDFWINVNLARCLENLDPPQHGEAIRFYTAAVALNHEVAFVHEALAACLRLNGQLDEALAEDREAMAYYRKAIELAPESVVARTYLGNALMRQGRPDEAALQYRKAIELAPGFALMHNNLANALYHQNKLEEAIAAYQEAIRLKADYILPHLNIAGLLVAGPDPKF